MKRLVAAALLSILIPSMASAATWVFKRRSSFPEFGKAQTIYDVKGKFGYPHSKTLIEKRDEVPYRYQVGFQQRYPFMPRPKRVYQIEVP